jgi:hypothetical protein
MTVSSRRSWRGAGCSAGVRIARDSGAATFAPQLEQNLASGGSVEPHAAHSMPAV